MYVNVEFNSSLLLANSQSCAQLTCTIASIPTVTDFAFTSEAPMDVGTDGIAVTIVTSCSTFINVCKKIRSVMRYLTCKARAKPHHFRSSTCTNALAQLVPSP